VFEIRFLKEINLGAVGVIWTTGRDIIRNKIVIATGAYFGRKSSAFLRRHWNAKATLLTFFFKHEARFALDSNYFLIWRNFLFHFLIFFLCFLIFELFFLLLVRDVRKDCFCLRFSQKYYRLFLRLILLCILI
jgi:hypothetical protein